MGCSPNAERAVPAGLALVEAVAGLDTAAETRRQVRVGIASGRCLRVFASAPPFVEPARAPRRQARASAASFLQR
jgi:hypothetical protein